MESKYNEQEQDEAQSVDDAETEPEEVPEMTQFTVPPEEDEEVQPEEEEEDEDEQPQTDDEQYDDGEATYDPVSPDVVDLTNEADDIQPGDVINLTVTDEGDEMDVIDRDLVRSVKRRVEWLVTDSDDSQEEPQPDETSSKKLRTGAHLEVVADDVDSETEEPAPTVTQSWLWMADLYVEIGYSCFSTPVMQSVTQLQGLVDANSQCGVQLQYIFTVLQNLSEELGGLLLVAMRSTDAELTMSQAALTVKVQYHWLMQLIHHHIYHEVKKMLKHLHYRDKMQSSWPDKYTITKRIATSHHIARVTEHVQSLMSDPPLQPETSAYKTYRRDEVMRMLDVVLRILGQYPPPDLSDVGVIELEKRLVWVQDLLKTTFSQDEYIHGALWRMVVVNADGWLNALAPILPPLPDDEPADDAPAEDDQPLDDGSDGSQPTDAVEDDSAPVDEQDQTQEAAVGAGRKIRRIQPKGWKRSGVRGGQEMAGSRVYTEKDQDISVAPGATFSLSTWSNGSVGDEWKFDPTPGFKSSYFRYVGGDYTPDNPDPRWVGGGGTTFYRFVAGPATGDATITLNHSFRGKPDNQKRSWRLHVGNAATTGAGNRLSKAKAVAGKKVIGRPRQNVLERTRKSKPKTGAGEAMTGKAADIEDDTVYELWRLMKDIATKEIASEKTPATGAGEAVKRRRPEETQPRQDDTAKETIAVYRRLILDEYKACLRMLLEIKSRLLPLEQQTEELLLWNSELPSADLLPVANRRMQQMLTSLQTIGYMVRRVYFQLMRDQEVQSDDQPRTGADMSVAAADRLLNEMEMQSPPTFSERVDRLPYLITPARAQQSDVESLNARLSSDLEAELWNVQNGIRRLGRLAMADYRMVHDEEDVDTPDALSRMLALSRVVTYRTVAIERLGTAIFSADWLQEPEAPAQVGAGGFFRGRSEELEIDSRDPVETIDLVSSDDDEQDVEDEIADIKQRLQQVKQDGQLIDLTLAIEDEDEKESEKVRSDPGGWRTKLRNRRFEPREEERPPPSPPDSRSPTEIANQIARFVSGMPFPSAEDEDDEQKRAQPGAGGMKRGRDRDEVDDSDKRWRPDEDYDPDVDSVPINDEFCERESRYLEQSDSVLNIWKDAAGKMHNAHGPALLLVQKRVSRLLRMAYFWHGMPVRRTGFAHAYYSQWTDGERSLQRKVWSHPDLPFVVQESAAGSRSVTKVRVRLDANRQPTHELLKGPPPGMMDYESFFSERFNDADLSSDAADVKEAEQLWNRAVMAREQDIARAKLKRRRDGDNLDDVEMLADKLSRTGAGEAVKRRTNGFDLDEPDSYQHKRVVFTGV